jgi:hypothetical protein
MTHGNEATHGNGANPRQRKYARQRNATHGNVLNTRQSSLPSDLREAHGKVVVAEHIVAVRGRTAMSLPCVLVSLPCDMPARQSTVLR